VPRKQRRRAWRPCSESTNEAACGWAPTARRCSPRSDFRQHYAFNS
jgi:hypothetical protein